MGLMDFIKGELIEIIEWTDDSRDTLSYRFPDKDKEIKRGAQLIVRESQVAQFVYLGQYGDAFNPGRYTLSTDNIPVLTTLRGWKYGFETPFKADVYYVTTRLFTGNQWGTSNPVMVRDQDFGIVRVRAFGSYDFRIVDAKRFLKAEAGTGAGMAAGLGVAQQMLSQGGGIMAQATPAAGASAAGSLGVPETLSPAEAARVLGVTEGDVIASLESGDLKGKRIGSQWRVT